MGNSESANLKRRERNRYLKRIERERGELEWRRKVESSSGGTGSSNGGAPVESVTFMRMRKSVQI